METIRFCVRGDSGIRVDECHDTDHQLEEGNLDTVKYWGISLSAYRDASRHVPRDSPPHIHGDEACVGDMALFSP